MLPMKNKLLLTYITFITALAISAVAIYYSVAGLAAIFSAAVIPIIIMGGILEVSKLVTTVWLHRYWEEAVWWLKTYLTIAVLVLMFITSMGIFGFLSRAHIEQTTASEESVAQVKRINGEIARQNSIVERAENRIKQLESGGGGADANIQAQIDAEQKRIDSVYSRIQPQIDEQNRIIDGQSKLFSDQIVKIDSDLALLQKYIDDKEVNKAQAFVGARVDGDWGPGTATAVRNWQAQKARQRAELVNKIQDINKDNSNIVAAREEIARLRKNAESQTAESTKIISRLREQVGKSNKSDDIDAALREQTTILKEAQAELDKITQEKYRLEGETRKLEAEVGPVKYIAEFVYGDDADKNMLERAVRWVIIIIIFVFDPLAVLLLLASQYSFEYHRREQKPTIIDDKVIDTDKSTEPPAPEIVSVVEPQEASSPTIFDQYLLTEINKTLSQELEERKEVEKSLIKMYEDEERDNGALHDKIEQLEKQLKTEQEHRELQGSMTDYIEKYGRNLDELEQLKIELGQLKSERDKLFAAHSHEMIRADELAQQLEIIADELTADSDISIAEPVISREKIVTDGVTREAQLYHPSQGYVNYEGKSVSIQALKGIRPDLIMKATDPENQILFGNQFPEFARTGDIYIRVDTLPHAVFKFNGRGWIEVNKEQNGSYLQYIPYIQYLIEKIDSREYDPDYLTDHEREDIERHIKYSK
jgi:hypothetical protein